MERGGGMLPRERLEIIKGIALKDKKVYVSKLSEKFEVTDETIRRDLEKLEAEGIVKRSYGGAILNSDKSEDDLPFYTRSKENIERKIYIAEKMKKFIKSGNTIVADCSSTVIEIFRLINNVEDVTVITNSVEIFQEMSNLNLNIISTGGILSKKSLSLQGAITKKTIQNYNVDIAMLSCSGLDLEKGIFDSNEAEAEIKRCMINQCSEVFLLADCTKFNKTSFVKLSEFTDIDYLITDQEPDNEWKTLMNSCNVKIIY